MILGVEVDGENIFVAIFGGFGCCDDLVIGNDGEDLYFGLVGEPFFKELWSSLRRAWFEF